MAARTKAARKPTRKSAPRTKRTKESDSDHSELGEESESEYDSDALDEEPVETKKRKRKPAAAAGADGSPSKSKAKRSPRKRKRVQADDDESEFENDDGLEVVGKVVQAPKTGLVPAGQISQNTLDFLTQLKNPECNDREWFKLHDPVYRQAEKEWKDFVEAFTDRLVEVDDQIPPLPPKDTRFSNDKTPYKQNFSASFSRSGRKGIFAFYHVMIKPGDQSMIAGGAWCPAKAELDMMRTNIKRDSSRLRDIIEDATFVKYFGEPKPGARRNIFGREDELKVAPKGVPKDHSDIDLLKCRSFAVSHQFTDQQVTAADFKETLSGVAEVLLSFVHCLNDMMTVNEAEEASSE
ncbi:unnamed protein product [Mycena citricolor]|uniref:TIGR02453 family protein n=1 Tax=Mycena citricolor TaxID=2018698 RepID=A0AAD2HN03_9AGAR|nr:unnamed protein product [Mycena citricolor]CAK5278385.1 unnamed protein product [Mycena citricolor]